MNLGQLISQKRIILTMGPGGVGKTTVAAALGLEAAIMGRKALVLTLDPAMRLADAMGLEAVPAGHRSELSVDFLRSVGIAAKATLNVEMLDTHKAWIGAISRHVSDPALRRRILEHPFFVRMSQDLVGAREYAAMEELYHLYSRGGYDLVILDTPPTVHGVDFVEAPDRVLDVLENDAYRWLMRPALLAGRMGLRMLNFSGGYAVRTLSRFTGMEFLRDLAGFVDLFSGLLEGFRQRAAVVRATLRCPVVSFVLITSPQPGAVDEVVTLYRRLEHGEMSPDALLVNRFSPPPPRSPDDSACREGVKALVRAARISEQDAEQIIASLLSVYHTADFLAHSDKHSLDSLIRRLPDYCKPLTVPLFDEDIHDLQGLDRLRHALFGAHL